MEARVATVGAARSGRRRVRRWVAVALAVPTLDACGADQAARTCDPTPAPAGRPARLVTSVSPITSIVSELVRGTDIEVRGVVPEGADSHTFEPGPAVAVALADADLVFLNGLQLEAELLVLVDTTATSVCLLGDAVLSPSEYVFDRSFPESGGFPNPHLWTNPPMVAEYARVIRGAVIGIDPSSAPIVDANMERFAQRVERLDRAVRDATATIDETRRLLVTYHDAYAYFARTYGWTIVDAAQPASFDEPSPADVAELIEQVRTLEVAALFGSEVFPSSVLEQIAAEAGARYVADLRDDDLPGEPGDPQHSWFELMRGNLVTIIEALGGDATAIRALELGDATGDQAVYP